MRENQTILISHYCPIPCGTLKPQGIYMTNFEFFVKNCMNTKYFDCQIVLNDYALLLIECDLKALLAVEENDVFYFMGAWEHFCSDSGVKNETSGFTYIASDYRNEDDDDLLEYWYSPDDFSVDILHELFDMGVDVEIIESYIPKLFEVYDVMARKDEDVFAEKLNKNNINEKEPEVEDKYYKAYLWNYKVFLMNWDGWIYGWRKKCNLMLGMSEEDKLLYKQVENLIRSICPSISCEIPPGCQWEWCKIVWGTIQVVRNGSISDEVYKYFSEHDMRSDSELFQKMYEQNRMELTEKLVKLIRES